MANRNNILVEYPKNKNIKFLFTSYPTEELTGRERVVRTELRLPNESDDDLSVAVEIDLSDLSESLQQILRKEINVTDDDTLVFRTFFSTDDNSLYSMSDLDVYNLVYDDEEWAEEKTNKKLN